MERQYTGTLRSLAMRGDLPPGGVVLPDREVKATVVGRLRENPYTQDFRIRVDVSDGIVHLDGEVDSATVRRAAADDAEVVPGVIAVDNDLVVAA